MEIDIIEYVAGKYVFDIYQRFVKFESFEKKTPVFALLNFEESTQGPYLGPLKVPKTPNDLSTLK